MDTRSVLGRVRPYVRRLPGAVALSRRLSSRKRAEDAQWRRIEAAVGPPVVAAGPFAGMALVRTPTGSHIPKRLGSYEAELHPLVGSWNDYARVIDVGCGEGWYVVGLARRMPRARIWGFDTSKAARSACREMAKANSVSVRVGELATPETLTELIDGRTLVIMDIEGAEDDLCDPIACPALRSADILVETHDFLRPGVQSRVVQRFPERAAVHIVQQVRDPQDHPVLATLSPDDQRRAFDEARPHGNGWLWLPAPTDSSAR